MEAPLDIDLEYSPPKQQKNKKLQKIGANENFKLSHLRCCPMADLP